MSFHYSSRKGHKIEWIVCHYPVAPGCNAWWCYDYYNRTNEAKSAHYAVGTTETVSIIPCSFAAYHVATSGIPTYCGARNCNSIGIDLMDNKMNKKSMSVKDRDWYIDERTLDRAAWLIAYLMRLYNVDINHVVRHYDVTHKWCMPIDTTELLTPYGWVSLKDVKVGDEIMTVSVPEMSGKFDKVLSVVLPYECEVINNHDLELTADHRVWSKPNSEYGVWNERLWGDIVCCGMKKVHQIPTSCTFGDGLDMSDDELRLLVWVQGDGYYYKFDGIEFHLSKERKIKRVVSLLERLGYHPSMHWCKNGSVHIRVRCQKLREFLDSKLDRKQFNFDLINMNQEQFEIFWEEALNVDGCVSGHVYTSLSEQSLDVVSALFATHGVRHCRTKISSWHEKVYDSVNRCSSNYTVGWHSDKGTRKTMVSCVTVPSGYILIRQKGRTYVVGNCPRPLQGDDINEYYKISGNQKWQEFKQHISEIVAKSHEWDAEYRENVK